MALSLPFDLGPAPPALRTPTLEGSLGALDADGFRDRLVRLTVDLRPVPGVDAVDAILSAQGGPPDVSPGDAVALSLGFGDGATTRVFTGSVDTVRPTLDGTFRVTAVGAGTALARLRLDRSYESMAAGDVVRDLLAEAGVDAGAVESGPSLPFFVVDGGRSGLAWIERLARACGFLSFADGEGAVHFAAPSDASVAAFAYGTDVLAMDVAQGTPHAAAATVVGEGAAGSQGQDAWAWLVKDPASVTGEAGSGAPAVLAADGGIRTADGATRAAEALVERAARAARVGELTVAGAPQVTVGGTVDVSGTPGGALDGSYLVLGVRHRIGGHRPLTTTLRVSGPGGAGGLLGALGGLL